MIRRLALVFAALALAACTKDPTGTMPAGLEPRASAQQDGGAVFVMSNDATANSVLAFARAADGTLTSAGAFATGGKGNGSGGSTQGALVLQGPWLLATNPGSNDVSVFRVSGTQLTLTDRVASGGTMPFSIAAHGPIVYVLNTGGAGNITGFRLTDGGQLQPIAGSTRGLGGSATGPAQVSFRPDGAVLMVTEKAANQLATYTVDAAGLASGPTLHPSAGMTPFGFAFRNDGVAMVSEVGGGPGASSASSYQVRADGSVAVVSGAVPDFQTAACWAVLSGNGRFAYIVNAGTSSLSGYTLGPDGALTLLTPGGVTATTAKHPIDTAVSENGRFIYSLATGAQVISGFAMAADGSLTPIGNFPGIPSSAAGLVAR